MRCGVVGDPYLAHASRFAVKVVLFLLFLEMMIRMMRPKHCLILLHICSSQGFFSNLPRDCVAPATRSLVISWLRPTTVPPEITWSNTTREFFWPAQQRSAFAVPNDQGFPLLLLEGLLAWEELTRARALATELANGAGAEVLTQYERSPGAARRDDSGSTLIRRSRVARLPPHAKASSAEGELRRLIEARLPPALVGDRAR